jgi:hypothetical protein
MRTIPRRGPKGLEFTPEAKGRLIFGGRACPMCGMRMFTLTGKWRLLTSKSSNRTLRRIQVRCMSCCYEWWSQAPRVIRLAAR